MPRTLRTSPQPRETLLRGGAITDKERAEKRAKLHALRTGETVESPKRRTAVKKRSVKRVTRHS